MRVSRIINCGVVLSAAILLTASASAQQRVGAGAGAGAGGAAAGGAAAAGGGAGTTGGGAGTTEGLGGLTTEGFGSATDGAVAGGNVAQTFVGGNNTGGFVGGGREATQNVNTNRQFRGITNTGGVPTGGQQQQSATPRRVPVSLRIGFSFPPPTQGTRLAGPNSGALDRFFTVRPELSMVTFDLAPSGVATISGMVPDAAARRLAENLVRIQPGVRSVDSRIAVAVQQ